MRREAARVGSRHGFLERPLNVDLSGGERKRSETLQMAMLRPSIAVLDELDSGIDIDGLRAVASGCARRWRNGVSGSSPSPTTAVCCRCCNPTSCTCSSTGRIVASGGPELAGELERTRRTRAFGGHRPSTGPEPAAN